MFRSGVAKVAAIHLEVPNPCYHLTYQLRQAESKMEADWDRRARGNSRRWSDVDDLKSATSDLQKLLDGIKVRKEATVLEIGVGSGRITKQLANHFEEVYGIDVSNEMIRLAIERLRDFRNVKIDKGDGRDLSIYPNCKFDLVFSTRVFQHLPRRFFLGYLDEVHRVMKPTGMFRFQIFERTAIARIIPWIWLRNMRHLHGRFWADPPDDDTWISRSYSREELTRILEMKGFFEIAMRNYSGYEGDLWVSGRPTPDIVN